MAVLCPLATDIAPRCALSDLIATVEGRDVGVFICHFMGVDPDSQRGWVTAQGPLARVWVRGGAALCAWCHANEWT